MEGWERRENKYLAAQVVTKEIYLVDGLFVAEDAELIKTIPLSRVEAEDVLF